MRSGGAGIGASSGRRGAGGGAPTSSRRGEERELALLASGSPRAARRARRPARRRRLAAVDPHDDLRAVAVEHERRVAGVGELAPRRGARAPSRSASLASPPRSWSIEPETIRRSIARVIAT